MLCGKKRLVRGGSPKMMFCTLVHVQRSSPSPSEIDRFIQDNRLEDLQAGECECLYLCQQIQIPLILTDDLAVRDAAKQLQLTPVGSLGIAVRAYRQGLITLAEAEYAITQLYDVSSLFVTRAISSQSFPCPTRLAPNLDATRNGQFTPSGRT